jgi:hypothetical protein
VTDENKDCPMGENCAVHHRIDEAVFDEETEYGRMITYVGDYAVVTTDNPELESPILLLRILNGRVKPQDIPPPFETCVIHVGQGALSSARELDIKGQRDAVRFIQAHSSWDAFQDAHDAIVEAIKEDMIDVSQSAYIS